MGLSHRFLAFAAALGMLVAGLSAPVASAGPSPSPSPAPNWSWADIQNSVDKQLAMLPGGRQVAPNKITWDKLGVDMEFAVPGQTRLAALCDYYHACLFGDVDYNGGPDVQPWKLSFKVCSRQDLGWWGKRNQMTSWINNQTPNTWTAIHQYRDEAHTEWGVVQLLGAGAYHADPWVGHAANDRADVIDVC